MIKLITKIKEYFEQRSLKYTDSEYELYKVLKSKNFNYHEQACTYPSFTWKSSDFYISKDKNIVLTKCYDDGGLAIDLFESNSPKNGPYKAFTLKCLDKNDYKRDDYSKIIEINNFGDPDKMYYFLTRSSITFQNEAPEIKESYQKVFKQIIDDIETKECEKEYYHNLELKKVEVQRVKEIKKQSLTQPFINHDLKTNPAKTILAKMAQ